MVASPKQNRPATVGPHYHPLIVVAAVVALGMIADRWRSLSFITWEIIAVAAWLGWWIAWRFQRDHLAAALLLVSIAAISGAWHQERWRFFGDDDLSRFAREGEQPAAIEAIVVSPPRRMPKPPFDPVRPIPVADHTRMQIETLAIRDGNIWRPASGYASLSVDGHLLGVHPGDHLRIYGRLNRPRPADNPGEYDRAAHLRGDRILSLLHAESPDCVEIVEVGSPWRITRWLNVARDYADEMLWRYVSRDEAGLAAAILLGNREELPPDRSEAFLLTGTVHIVTIAGLHVGVLAWLLFQGLRLGLVPRGPALFGVMVITACYAWLTGSEPPVMRAAVMVAVVCWSLWRGRGGLKFNSLAVAALVIMLYNPADLFRTGSQLSFLAVGCFVWLGSQWRVWFQRDALDRLIADTRPWPVQMWNALRHYIWQGLIAGTIVFFVTLPLVMARFHTVAPTSIPLNVIVIVPMQIAMVAGFGVLTLGGLIPGMGQFCGRICDIALSFLDHCIVWASKLPGGHAWVAGPSDWWLIGFYGGLALWLAIPAIRFPRRWLIAFVLAWSAIGSGVSWLRQRPHPDTIECAFVSVGHGLAVVVHLPDGRTLLYDSGSMISPHVASRAVSGYLWERGITHLDAVFLSHADTDHFNAVPELLDRFSIGAIYVSPVMFKDQIASLAKLKASISAHGTTLRETWRGDNLLAGENCRVEVLHPPKEGLRASDNANCVVLAVEAVGRRILLTGDLEPPGLQEVITEQEWKCDVLSAPHHGSVRSLPEEILNWSRPEWVVISGGERENTDKVRTAYSSTGSVILNTYVDGEVSICLDRERVQVTTFRDGKFKSR